MCSVDTFKHQQFMFLLRHDLKKNGNKTLADHCMIIKIKLAGVNLISE